MNYPEETLDPDWDDGTIVNNKEELESAVVGHRIVSIKSSKLSDKRAFSSDRVFIITLDNGQQVEMYDTNDCCAYTELKEFLFNVHLIDHIITGVGTTDQYDTWHIYADMGDVLKLTIGWSCGNPFYYGYGFEIRVRNV